ncbi:MAG: 2-hydroxy-3-oxopropionate reductase [Verrucomicrobiales bacterium]|jgi:2-hydroxy-3-oxopropionate reductase
MEHLWSDRRVAFIGIGPMGSEMAPHLLQAGIPLTVWNRTSSRCQPLQRAGAVVAPSVEAAVADADAVVLSLANGDVVESVLFASGASSYLRPGCTVIDMSSVPPPVAKDHAARLAQRDVRHLDAPVSGGTKGAHSQSLAIMVGGEADTFTDCEPILQVFGNPVYVGPSGAGQFTKLCNQIIVGVTLAAVSEAMIFAKAGGADPAAVREALLGGFADSRILREHGQRMVDRDFAPGGVARNQLKDLNTALSVAAASGLTLPVTQIAQSLYDRLCGTAEGAELDHTAVLTTLEQMNGYDSPPPIK